MAIRRILQIRLENFQSHKDTTIDFSSGVTVLAGESSNGKTAILRGLQWVLTNRPMGIGFISHWAKGKNTKGDVIVTGTCRVTVKVEDMEGTVHTISRERSADTNCYIVDGSVLGAVGSDVPPVVKEIMRMEDVNIQAQDDSYFMLCMSPGQVAAKLNELVHLDTIDEAYKFIHRKKLDTNVLLKEATFALSKANVAIDSLKHIPQLEDDFELAEDVHEKLVRTTNKLTDLSDVRRSISNCQLELRGLEKLPTEEGLVRLNNLVDMFDEKSELIANLTDIQTDLENLTTAIEAIPSVKVDEELSVLVREADRLSGVLVGLNNIYESVASVSTEIGVVEEETSEVKEQLPETCPLCGSAIRG